MKDNYATVTPVIHTGCSEEERLHRLEEVIQMAEARLKAAPPGRLHLSQSTRGTYYYHYLNGRRRYLAVGNPLIQVLAQKDYDERVLKAAVQEKKLLVKPSRRELDFPPAETVFQPLLLPEQVFETLPAQIQQFAQPIEPGRQQKLQLWEQVPYEGKGFLDNDAIHYTRRGERVRSKSEALIGDWLADAGFPYRYECPITLRVPSGFQGSGRGQGLTFRQVTVYPDFTILHPATGELILWEHFGRMNETEPDYVASVWWKLELYRNNGLLSQGRFLYTLENRSHPLNAMDIALVIEELEKRPPKLWW